MKELRQMVVIAGGLGTRMESAGLKTAKSLIEINGMTLVEHIFREAVNEGFNQILWCLGHRSDEIQKVINSLCTEDSRSHNEVIVESERLGTLGALVQARTKLRGNFCVVLGDLLIQNTNIGKLHDEFQSQNLSGLLTLKYTSHAYDSDLVRLDNKSLIKEFLHPPHKGEMPKNAIGNSGIAFFKKECIPQSISSPADLFRDLIPSLLQSGQSVKGVFHQGTIRDVGTPERLESIYKLDIKQSPLNEKRAILFDRDGTLNLEVGHISSEEQLLLFPFTSKLLVSALDNFDFCGIITNQPVIARGEATLQKVEEITLTLLEKSGASDATNFVLKICPHHPDKGHVGEIPSLKINCSCRKPEVGLFLEFFNEHQIRVSNTVYVGNKITDLLAASRLGMRWIHLREDFSDDCDLHSDLGGGVCVTGNELLLRISLGKLL